MLAPIVIFAFNRLAPLENTIASLLKNSEAKESDLYLFVDGAREGKIGEQEKVERVCDFVKSITGFRSLHYTFSEKNQGLGPSIIAGVTEVINKYGKAIVLEDDLIVMPNFLSFMNQGLDRYRNAKEVFSVCGYSNRLSVPKGYSCDTYFCTRSSSWGWGTWADRWCSVDWELKEWHAYESYSRDFNRWGGSDCWKMLNDWHNGKNKSWAIRFCFAQFMQDKVSLFPIKSLVQNEGFDGEGTNCKKWSRFKYVLDLTGKKDFTFPSDVTINNALYKSARSYHSIPMRLWSRIMYLVYN